MQIFVFDLSYTKHFIKNKRVILQHDLYEDNTEILVYAPYRSKIEAYTLPSV